MRQKFRVCLHQNPFPAKAKPLLGDMETFPRHYFFLYILDMNITLVSDSFPHLRGGSNGS